MNSNLILFLLFLYLFEVCCKGNQSSSRGTSSARNATIYKPPRPAFGNKPKWTKNHGWSSWRGRSKVYLEPEIDDSRVIISPSTPMIFNNRSYYWNGYYPQSINNNSQCQYEITEKEQKMNISFPDGTRPTHILFNCKYYQNCCKLDCCFNFMPFKIAIPITLVVAFLIFRYCRKIEKQEDDNVNSDEYYPLAQIEMSPIKMKTNDNKCDTPSS